MAISYTDQPPGGAAPPDATAVPAQPAPAPPYQDIPAGGAGSATATPAETAAPTGHIRYQDYDPTVGPGIGREVAGTGVSGLAGGLGSFVDFPSTVIEAGVINPARHMAHDISSIVSGEPGEQWAKEAKDIEEHPTLATGWGKRGLERGAEAVGLPTIETAPAQTWFGRIGQRLGETGIEFLTPGAIGKAAGLLKEAPRIPELIKQGADIIRQGGELMSPGSTTGNAVIGAATGAVQQTAAEAGASPAVQKTLGLLTPAVVGAIPVGARGAIEATGTPLTQAQTEEMAKARAGQAFRRAVGDPTQAESILRQGIIDDQARQQTIPGSPVPTTGEMLNDPNVLRAQRIRERKSADFGETINLREAAANDAQWRALQGLADPNTNARATQNILSFYRNTLDQHFAQTAEATRAEAERTTQAAQPTMTPEQQGQVARAAIQATREPLTQQLQQALQDAGLSAEQTRDILGGIEPLSPEAGVAAWEQAGRAFRDPAIAVDEAHRQALQRLRQAIDPTGTMSMNKYAIHNALEGIRRDFQPEFFSGKENQLYSHIDGWGNQIPLEDAFKLREEVNSQLRNRDILPSERLRLSRLRDGIDQATDDAVDGIHQDQVVANGGKPTTTVAKDVINLLDQLGPNWVENWGQHLRGDPERMRQAMRDPLTAEVLRRTDPNTATAAAQTLHPMDEAAQQQYRDWAEQYRTWKQRMQSETGRPGQLHAVGKMLEKGGAYDAYKLPDGRVPGLFIEGKDAPLAIDRFIAAVGPEIAGPVLEDAFKLSLRSQPGIRNADGTMNSKVFNKWFSPDRQAALSRVPNDVLSKFQNAGVAQQRLEEADAAFAQHEQDYPLKAGLNDSAILGKFWKAGPEGGEMMRQYGEMTGGRPEALAAARDYAAYDFANYAIDKNTGMVNANRANTWISQHALALGQFPGLRDSFLDAATAQRTFEDTLSRRNWMLSAFDKSVAGQVLGADVDKVAEGLLKGDDRLQRVRELKNWIGNMGTPKESAEALEGLKRAVIDHIHREYGGTLKPGSEWPTLNAHRFHKFLSDNEDVFRTLFGNDGWNVLDTVSEDVRRASLVQNAKRAGGSDTAELLQGMGANRNAAWWPWFQAYAMERLAEHAGAALGHATLGPAVGLIGTIMGRKAREHLNIESDKALDDILLHPSVAADALNAYTNPRRFVPTSTMHRYYGRLVQSLILNSEGHRASIPRYRLGGRVRLQGGGDVPSTSPPPTMSTGIWSPGYFGHIGQDVSDLLARPVAAAGRVLSGAGQAIAGDIGDLARGMYAAGPGTLEQVWGGKLPPGAPETESAARQTALTFGFGAAPEGASLRAGVGPRIGGAAGAHENIHPEVTAAAAAAEKGAAMAPAEAAEHAAASSAEVPPTGTPAEPEVPLVDRLRAEHMARGSQALPLSGARMPVTPPPHIRSMDDVNGLVNRYVDLAQQGEAAKNWYLESGRAIARATNDMDTAGKFTSAIARTSPQTDVATNLTHAITLHNQAMLGDPLRGGRFPEAMGADVEKYYYGNQPVTGEKIAPFHNALDVGWNPDFPHTYVNDVWNMRALEYPGVEQGKLYDGTPTLGQHNFTRIIADRALDELERRTQKIDAEGNPLPGTGQRWDPKELQAASWAAIKSREEGEPLATTAQNYAHGLARNYAQASWESAPGMTTGHLPEFHTAPLHDRQAFHNDIRSVMVDDQGNDIIHRHLGLLTAPSFDAPGYFRGAAAPGTQAPAAVGQAPGGMKIGVDPASRQLMNVGEAVRSLLLRQDALAWLKPSYSASLANKNLSHANMADIRVGRSLTMDEADAVGHEMERLTGSDFFSPIATLQGYRLYNVPAVTGLTNREFWGKVDQLVAAHLHPDAGIVHAIADGNYVENNWRRMPRGQNFIQEIRRTRRPDVQRAAAELLATLGPRIQSIEENWAQTHGWTPNRASRIWNDPQIQGYSNTVVPNPPRPWIQRPTPRIRVRDPPLFQEGGAVIPHAPSPPAGVFWKGGAIIPQAIPYRFH